MRKVEVIVEYATDEENFIFRKIKGELIRCANCIYGKEKAAFDKYTEDPMECEYWHRGTSKTGHCDRAIWKKKQ